MIPTRRGYPAAQAAIEGFAREVDGIDAEIVVMAASSVDRPSVLPPAVRWIPTDHSSVFQLRQAGYRVVLGEIVAVTEDHCRPAEGWADAILAAHAGQHDAVAIVGSVRNGSTRAAIDWGAFFITQVPHMAPLRPGPYRSVGGPIVTYRRAILERIVGRGSLGAIELLDSHDLLRPGETFVPDARIEVFHDQSLGFIGTSAIEFDNGRAVAGFRRLRPDVGDLARVFLSPAIFAYRVVRTVRGARSKRVPSRILDRALPAIVWLHVCNSAGEVVGYLIGPGDSANRLN